MVSVREEIEAVATEEELSCKLHLGEKESPSEVQMIRESGLVGKDHLTYIQRLAMGELILILQLRVCCRYHLYRRAR